MFLDIKVSEECCMMIQLDGGFFIIVNIIISLFGIFGNIFVCLIIFLILSLWVILNYCIVNFVFVDLIVVSLIQLLVIVIFVGKFGGMCYVKVEYVVCFVGNLFCLVLVLILVIMSVD